MDDEKRKKLEKRLAWAESLSALEAFAIVLAAMLSFSVAVTASLMLCIWLLAWLLGIPGLPGDLWFAFCMAPLWLPFPFLSGGPKRMLVEYYRWRVGGT